MKVDVSSRLFLWSGKLVDGRVDTVKGRAIAQTLPIRANGADDEAGLIVCLLYRVLRNRNCQVDRLLKWAVLMPVAIDVSTIGAGDSSLGSRFEVVVVRVLDDGGVVVKDLGGPLRIVQVTSVVLLHMSCQASVDN